MNRIARVFLASLMAFILIWSGIDLWLYLTIGGESTISTGIRGAPPGVVFLIGHGSGGIVWGLYVHWFLNNH